MTLEIWLAYVLASAILLVVPGPTIMLVVSYALAEGRRSAWGTVVGVGLGDLTAMTVSFVGLGAVVAASAALFGALKWAAAAYLVVLGVQRWRAGAVSFKGATALTAGEGGRSQRTMAGHAFVVTALNPKGIAFFAAFVPHFLVTEAPVAPQLMILGATFLVLAVVNAAAYALLAGTVRGALTRPGAGRAANRIGGGLLIGAGLITASLRRTG